MDREENQGRMKNIRVSAAVIHDGSSIFATERGYGEWKGKWEFPGGKREEGENGEDTVKREIMEELETRIEVEDFLCTVEYDYPSFHLTMDTYIAKVVEGKLILKEHEDAKWISLPLLDDLDWLDADKAVVQEVKRYFSLKGI